MLTTLCGGVSLPDVPLPLRLVPEDMLSSPSESDEKLSLLSGASMRTQSDSAGLPGAVGAQRMRDASDIGVADTGSCSGWLVT